jgi:alpha-N-arabinofuranosidase
MYKDHQDATLLPVALETPDYVHGEWRLPMLSATASADSQGKIQISLVNIDPDNHNDLTIDLRGIKPGEVSGRILTSGKIQDHNSFEEPDLVKPEVFNAGSFQKGMLEVTIPAKSIVVLNIDP